MRWPRRRRSCPHKKAPTNDLVSFAEFQREVAEATVAEGPIDRARWHQKNCRRTFEWRARAASAFLKRINEVVPIMVSQRELTSRTPSGHFARISPAPKFGCQVLSMQHPTVGSAPKTFI